VRRRSNVSRIGLEVKVNQYIDTWSGDCELTIPIGGLPLAFNVLLPEVCDRVEDFVLSVQFVPEVIEIWIPLGDSYRKIVY